MNRPDKSDKKYYYLNKIYMDFNDVLFISDLEKYCNFLEQRLENYGIEINPCDGCKDYCYKNFECKSNGGCGYEYEIKKLKQKNEEYVQEVLLLQKEVIRLEKVFNKACRVLHILDFEFHLHSVYEREYKNIHEWKEYLLSDE